MPRQQRPRHAPKLRDAIQAARMNVRPENSNLCLSHLPCEGQKVVCLVSMSITSELIRWNTSGRVFSRPEASHLTGPDAAFVKTRRTAYQPSQGRCGEPEFEFFMKHVHPHHPRMSTHHRWVATRHTLVPLAAFQLLVTFFVNIDI